MNWKFWERASGMRASSPENPSTNLSSPAQWLLDYFGVSTDAGVTVSERTAMKASAVYGCVTLIAKTIGSLPLKVYRRKPNGDSVEVPDTTPYYLLHDEPNPAMTSCVWREFLTANILLGGNAYAMIGRDQGNRVIDLFPIPHNLVRPERVKLVAADTERTPIDLGSYSSRVTFMAGNACLDAAKNMRALVLEGAARKLACDAAQLEMRDERVFVRDDASKGITFDEAVIAAIEKRGALVASGSYRPPEEARGGKHKGAGVGPSPSYSYGAQMVEVTVDEDTGHVTIDRIVAAHDCGRALNPLAVEGQVIGSVYMGMGQAMQEEMVWSGGRLMNPSLLEYRIPSTLETPPIESIIVESIDPEGPYGAKEAGEGSLAATIPAIANAIYDAVGVRITSLPLSPEKILAGIRDRQRREAAQAAGNGKGAAR